MKTVLEELLTPDQIKVLYRGNFTIKQAGLYLGAGEVKIRELINSGSLAVNIQDGQERISREECDNYLRSIRFIKKVV